VLPAGAQMTFRAKIVILLLLLAVTPVVIAFFLVERALDASQDVEREHEDLLMQAMERSAQAYRDLFEARKEEFRATTRAIAATWNGHIDDPEARYIRKWRVLPDGPSGDASATFPQDNWRGFSTVAKLPDGKTLEIEYVANRERSQEYEA